MDKTILLLMVSDVFLLTGFGLMQPILSIFIKDNLVDGTVFAAGIAVMLFMLTKSLVQLPLSKIVDKRKRGFRIKLVIAGTFVVSLVPFIYIFATQVIYIYLAQIIYGLGSGLAFPSWMGLWSKNSAIYRKSYDWSIYSTATGIGTAIAAVVGATIAELLGFSYTFILVGVLAIFACFSLLGLELKTP
ncbi:MAG: MFS transporter [Candidatus Bathyarchaeota archaeon]|nr:MFS transporter [Candidatus Bathyarchaeum tardum]WGM89274.1 MAG: MFS transporter [Candidatus Bathyarchaeum tardum]WNZ28492.1 MAG: MFS transporter [Candidatus Bathyarchaeota archaeon]